MTGSCNHCSFLSACLPEQLLCCQPSNHKKLKKPPTKEKIHLIGYQLLPPKKPEIPSLAISRAYLECVNKTEKYFLRIYCLQVKKNPSLFLRIAYVDDQSPPLPLKNVSFLPYVLQEHAKGAIPLKFYGWIEDSSFSLRYPKPFLSILDSKQSLKQQVHHLQNVRKALPKLKNPSYVLRYLQEKPTNQSPSILSDFSQKRFAFYLAQGSYSCIGLCALACFEEKNHLIYGWIRAHLRMETYKKTPQDLAALVGKYIAIHCLRFTKWQPEALSKESL